MDFPKVKHRLSYNEAYKLMNRKDATGRPVPFLVRYISRADGHIIDAEVERTFSYNRMTGMRKLRLANGEFRNCYDVLILRIDDTKIIVS